MWKYCTTTVLPRRCCAVTTDPSWPAAQSRTSRLAGSGLHFIPPGEPWRNGYVESFNSRVRDECLDINSFLVPGPRPSGHRRLETRLQPLATPGPRLSTEPPARYAATCTHPSTALVLVDQFTGSDHGDRAKGSIVLDLSCQLPRTRPVGSSRRI
jgi:Integrase core domain